MKESVVFFALLSSTLVLSAAPQTPSRYWFVNNQASPGGNGSLEAPFATLQQAEQASQEGEGIYVFYGDGTSQGMNEGIILKREQRLISEKLETPPLITNTSRPGHEGRYFGVQLAEGSEVIGFRFDGKLSARNAPFDAIQAIGVTHFNLEKNCAANLSTFLYADSIENGVATISGNTVEAVHNAAMLFFGNLNNTSITVTENTLQDLRPGQDRGPGKGVVIQGNVANSSILFSRNAAENTSFVFSMQKGDISNSQISVIGNQIINCIASTSIGASLITHSNLSFTENAIIDGTYAFLFQGELNPQVTVALIDSKLDFSRNMCRSASKTMIEFTNASLDPDSTIAVVDNQFEAILTSNVFGLSDFDRNSTGGTVLFTGNEIFDCATALHISSPIPLNYLTVRDNHMMAGGLSSLMSAALEGTAVCVENNISSESGLINGHNLCVHFVNNDMPGFQFTGGSADEPIYIESPWLATDGLKGVQSMNPSLGTLTVPASVVYVELDSCGSL